MLDSVKFFWLNIYFYAESSLNSNLVNESLLYKSGILEELLSNIEKVSSFF